MTKIDRQKEISLTKEGWRESAFSNIIFDKRTISKYQYHDHLIRIYEGLNHIKSIKMFISAEMISIKSIYLERNRCI